MQNLGRCQAECCKAISFYLTPFKDVDLVEGKKLRIQRRLTNDQIFYFKLHGIKADKTGMTSLITDFTLTKEKIILHIII